MYFVWRLLFLLRYFFILALYLRWVQCFFLKIEIGAEKLGISKLVD